MATVQRLCSRVLVLSQGRLVADNTAKAGVARYLELAGAPEAGAPALAERPRAREDFGSELRISGCELLDAGGRGAAVLRFGEPLRVRVELCAEGAFKDLSLLVGIDAFDETRIATALSRDAGCLFAAEPGAPLAVVASFPHLTLRPGSYRVTLGVAQGQRPLDHLLAAVGFQVSEACAEGVAPFEVTVGHLRAEADWRIAEPC
jgi:hypothetical protein